MTTQHTLPFAFSAITISGSIYLMVEIIYTDMDMDGRTGSVYKDDETPAVGITKTENK